MNGQAIGLVYIAASFCGMSGIFSHRFTERFRVRNTGIILMILPVVSCAVLSFSDNAFPSVSAVLLMEAAFALYQPYLEELQNRMAESGDRAAELSMQSMFSGLICSAVSAVFGLVAGISLNAAFRFGAVICICGTLLLAETVRG